MAVLEAQLKIGEYELIRLLGRGGMGEVWMALDLRADRRVAVKFIKPHLLEDPTFRTRFLNEARTLGRLEHDRIVSLYNVIDDGTHLALVLRFIEGKSLADRIDAEGILPPEFVMSSSRDLLSALGFAHKRGIIHRDIKPENVLIDSANHSLLTDFGIAVTDFAERGTMTGFSVGTPQYMSPEQIRTPREITMERRGHRADIYSFGIVLFEMLTGRVPFGSHTGMEDTFQIQAAHCTEPPPRIREINANVSASVEAVVDRCLAKNPDERPQSCEELLADLEAVFTSKVMSRPATVFEAAPASPAKSSAAAARPPARAGLPKWLWPAMGAVVIIVGIAYAVEMGNHTEKKQVVNSAPAPPTSTAPVPEKPVQLGGGNIPTPNPNAVAAQQAYRQATEMRQAHQPCPAKDQARKAVVQEPRNPQYSNLLMAVTQECAAMAGENTITSPPLQISEAEQHYKAAQQQFNDGEYCAGKAEIDEAVAIASSRKYLALQKQLANGCNASMQ